MLQYFIYGILIVFLTIVIYGTVSRKKIYNEVDRLEEWKIQIMNKPVTDEISKIKGLNMSGETEKKFESWRNEWDEIITLKLPNLEEKLFDVEEAANKYRFIKARNIAEKIAKELNVIEVNIQEMMDDINLLIHSEEDNRQQIDEVRAYFKEFKKYYSQKRSTLGITAYVLEQKIREIDQMFVSFDEATKEGNYFEAREILITLTETIDHEKWKIEEIPKLLLQIENEIPSQLSELSQGIEEMEEDGYIVEHFSFKKDVENIKNQLHKLLPIIEEGNIEAANIPISDMYNEIEHMYDTLEQEVLAKQFVYSEIATLNEQMSAATNELLNLKADVEEIKLSYHIPEEELKLHLKLEKQIKELANKLKLIEDVISNKKQSYIAIKKTMEHIHEELKERLNMLNGCQETLNSLRKEELYAKETLNELKGKVREGQRLIKKSNIPGLPTSLLTKIEEAETNLLQASEKMNTIPIIIGDVNLSIEKAFQSVNEMHNLIQNTIEQALLAERVIQYGNRFRSSYSYIDEELIKAEQFFREYQYEEAVHTALTAIEEVDPSALEIVNSYSLQKV